MRAVYVSTGMFMEVALGKFLFGDWQSGKVRVIWMRSKTGESPMTLPSDTGNLLMLIARSCNAQPPLRIHPLMTSSTSFLSLRCSCRHSASAVKLCLMW